MASMLETVKALLATGERAAGSDGERRAATLLRTRVRALGREAELEPVWGRPGRMATHAWHAVLGVLGSVLAALVPAAGVAVLGLTLLSLLLEASGRGWLARRLTWERASQNVVSPAPQDRPFRLLLTANYDAGRVGAVYASRFVPPFARRAGATAWLGAALFVLLACAISRLAGAGGAGVGIVQLVPTAGLIVGVMLFFDIVLSSASPAAGDNAAGVAVALALAAALDRAPPRRLAVELILAGAGEAPALGLRAHLRRRRRELPREKTIVVALSACGAGAPVWATANRQLRALCERVARAESHLGARAAGGRLPTAASLRRPVRLPVLMLGARDEQGAAPFSHTGADDLEHIDPASLDAVLEFALAALYALDDELARTA